MKTRQRSIVNAITAHIERVGYPPSMREIGEAVGLKSPSTVHGHLIRLKEKGIIEWEPLSPRTLKIKK